MNSPKIEPVKRRKHLPRNSIRPAQPPKSVTWVGRHFEVMQWLKLQFSRRKALRPLRALVAGFGGGLEGEDAYPPIQHLEAALVLHGTNHPFRMIAMDPNPDAVRQAQEALTRGDVDVHYEPPSVRIGKNYPPRRGLFFEDYLRALCGFTGPVPKRMKLSIPPKVRQNIRIQGPGIAGDVMKGGLPKSNDLVVCTNLSPYFSKKTQPFLAKRLFEATGAGGFLVVESSHLNEPFIETLLFHFSRYQRPQVLHTAEGHAIYVFQKTLRRDKANTG